MAQLVIPTFSKLELAFPDAVFELYQQMKSKDSLSFQALGSQDVIYDISIKKLEGFISQFQIESTDPEASVLELKEDSWRCELKGITSEAFLLPGNVTNAAEADEDQKEEISGTVSLLTQPTDVEADLEESQEDTILTAAMATSVTTSEVTTDLDLPKTETTDMESIIMPLDGITLVTPGVEVDLAASQQGQEVVEVGERDLLPLQGGDEPEEEASVGRMEEGGEESVGLDDRPEDVTEKTDSVEIVFGKNKKITVSRGSETNIVVREEEQRKHDKMVQSEVSDLLDGDQDGHIEDTMATSFNLDMTLTEAAMAVDKAQVAVKDLIEKRSTDKFIDQSCQMSKFPIVMQGNKYKCHLCGLLLIKKHYLVAHMRYVHKICVRDPLSRLQCPKCHLTFVRKNRLDEHVAHKHSDRKDHFCDVAGCEMAFKTVYNLRDHKRIYHYHMLRYACDICGKLYENPNTAERHRHICASKNREKYGKKSAEQLRNPNWVPIDELFQREPLPKRNKLKNKAVSIKEEEILENVEIKYEPSEDTPIMTDPTESPTNAKLMKSKNQVAFTIKSEKDHSLQPTGYLVNPLTNGEKQEKIVISEDSRKCSEEGKVNTVKRKTDDVCAHEVPLLKKIKSEERKELTETVKASIKSEPPVASKGGDNTPVVAVVKVENQEKSVSQQQSECMLTDAPPHKSSNSTKATQLPLKDLLKFIKKTEAALKKQTNGNCGKAEESCTNEVHAEKAMPTFSVTGILNRHKVYPLKLDELRRRLYGPETLNPVALMSFVNKTEHCSKMAELKRQLTEIGFTVPRFTTVTSSFTKLCEGEVCDLYTDFQDLQQTYFKPESLEKCLINNLLVSSHESADLATWLQHLRDLLKSVQVVLYDHISDFDQVTHGLAKRVFQLFLALYERVLTEAVCKFERRQACYDEVSSTIKNNRNTGGVKSDKDKDLLFEVQSMLSVKCTSYTVSSEEIQRRSQLPEQMAMSLLQQYIHKSKDKMDLEKACEQVGVILQRGNRTYVRSCLSLLIEAEANKLCTDFEILFDDHLELDDVMREFVKTVSIETKKGQLTHMLHHARSVIPYVETAIRNQYQDFDLVTHGIGGQLAEFTWTSFVKVVDLAQDFCTRM